MFIKNDLSKYLLWRISFWDFIKRLLNEFQRDNWYTLAVFWSIIISLLCDYRKKSFDSSIDLSFCNLYRAEEKHQIYP